MKKFFIILAVLLVPATSYSDSESSIGGKTAQSHIIQCDGVSFRPRPYMNFPGASCEDTGGKTVVTISGGSGGAGNTFLNWNTPLGTNLVADSTTDTVTFASTGPLTITGTAASDTITFAATDWEILPDGSIYEDDGGDIIIGGNSSPTADIFLGNNGTVIFNKQNNAVDFAIYGDNNQDIFFVDGSTEMVGIGTSTPTNALTLEASNGGSAVAHLHNQSDTADNVVLDLVGNVRGTPANGDQAHIDMMLTNSSGDDHQVFTHFIWRADDVTDGSEEGEIAIEVLKSGTMVEMMSIRAAETTFNQEGRDVNFRVEGDTDANLLFVDAGLESIGIGTNSPSGRLDIEGGDVFIGTSTLDNTTASEDLLVSGNLEVEGSIYGTNLDDVTEGTTNYYVHSAFTGAFSESFDALATSDGATITTSLEKSGGGDLTMQFSDGLSTLDCTPICTIALTAGSDTAPQSNYIYILQSTKAITKSTAAWPTAEHIKVAYFFVQSATFVNTANRGALINQNWNDHLVGSNNMGHVVHISETTRIGAGYFSGIDGNGSDNFIDIVTNVGTPDNVYIKTTSGFSYQMHKHTVPAKDTAGTDVIHVVNHNTTPYTDISDLNTQLTDASGGSLSGKYFNIIFGIIANKSGEYTPLVVNLPTGSYTNLSNAINDVDNYDVVSGPREFLKDSTTGIFIARVTFKHSASSGGTWTVEGTSDLRLGAIGGGSSISSTNTEFSDNQFKIFDESDITKIIEFDVGTNITTGNTRTLAAPDKSGTIIVDDGSGNVTLDGGLYVDGDTFYVNSSLNRVGIGTSAPSGLLDVEGGDSFFGSAALDNTSASEDVLITGNLEVERYVYADLGFVGDGSQLTGLPGGGDALTTNPLSQFAATTSAQFAGVISDETGTGLVVLGTSPTLITPALGTPSALVGTNITGTASGLTAGNVTTNANLTGIVTSVGNATSIANKAIAIAKLADGTDGELITWDASGVITNVAVGTATHVLTSNGVGAAPTFQAPSGGAATFYKSHSLQAGKLPSTDPAGIEGGLGQWGTRFNDTIDQSLYVDGTLYPYEGGTLNVQFDYTAETTTSSDVAAFDIYIECKTDGDATYDTDSFGTANAFDSPSQSLTAGTLDTLTGALSNGDGCVVGDRYRLRIKRTNSRDGVIDDLIPRGLLLYE